MNPVEEARAEILQKPRVAIEEETARKWAARAVAASILFKETGGHRWLHDALDYAHEACEHAAFADQTGQTLQSVRAFIRQRAPVDGIV